MYAWCTFRSVYFGYAFAWEQSAQWGYYVCVCGRTLTIWKTCILQENYIAWKSWAKFWCFQDSMRRPQTLGWAFWHTISWNCLHVDLLIFWQRIKDKLPDTNEVQGLWIIAAWSCVSVNCSVVCSIKWKEYYESESKEIVKFFIMENEEIIENCLFEQGTLLRRWE